MGKLNITNRTKVNRLPQRASYDIEIINKILDGAFVCQIGFVYDDQVNVIPTLYGRRDNLIFFHGSKNSRMLKSLSSGKDVCVSVTILDGLVLARSAFHHSVNYRSVIIYGKPNEILDQAKKIKALKAIMEHIIPGRWNEIRKPIERELNLTSVFSIKIDEASAKFREGGPVDDKEDYNLDVWAGVIPIKTLHDGPIKDEFLREDVLLPDYLKKINSRS